MESGGDSASPGGDQDSGISLQIPSWKGPPMMVRVRDNALLRDKVCLLILKLLAHLRLLMCDVTGSVYVFDCMLQLHVYIHISDLF